METAPYFDIFCVVLNEPAVKRTKMTPGATCLPWASRPYQTV